MNFTLTCQGHDVGQHHSGVHIAIFGDHDEDQPEVEQSQHPSQQIAAENTSIYASHEK